MDTEAPIVVKQNHPVAPILLAAVILALAVLGAGWMNVQANRPVQFDKPYQAVLLSNGQVYYGRLEGYGTAHPVLREVYYIQTGVDPKTQERTNVLTQRGQEWHAPDRMYLNPNQIVLVETVGTNSKVADLIEKLKSKN
jgi:hypothetical protein